LSATRLISSSVKQEPFQERRVIRVMTAHDEIDCRRFATIGRLITDQGRKFCA
jgi:hypothetical protein